MLLSCLTAAATGMFTVLAGPTGSGKTSLVSAISSVLGAGTSIVPVRPGWLDPTDLLGFFDPHGMRFQPTSFMDALVESQAHTQKDRLHLILLDEMNLSRIENYAADLLSRLEKAHTGEEDGRLTLYSEQQHREARAHWGHLLQASYPGPAAGPLHPDAAIAYSRLTNLALYPPRLTIPHGALLVGTINPDETTHQLSPKFLDRSFVIKKVVTASALKFTDPGARRREAFTGAAVRLSDIRAAMNTPVVGRNEEQLLADLNAWNTDLANLGIHVGFRITASLSSWMKVSLALGYNSDHAADLFFVSKLLPLVFFHRDQLSSSSRKTKLSTLQQLASSVIATGRYKHFGRQLQELSSSGQEVISYIS